jgi:hypothetical protein
MLETEIKYTTEDRWCHEESNSEKIEKHIAKNTAIYKFMNHKIIKFLYVILVGMLIESTCLAQSVWISEIVADNKDSLLDEDGDSPDWIELYNSTDSAISLDGWYLTDDATDLTKWSFPATTIASKGFIVVFASKKNLAVSGEELHTNFKLSTRGEYVALVQTNGSTIEHDITFPALKEDISYGYEFESSSLEPVTILETSAPCTAHVPTSESDATGWIAESYDDSGWLSGTTGVGYEANNNDYGYDYRPLIGLDVTTAMRYVNPSIYIRVPFSIENANAVRELNLKMKYDDGFAVYINSNLVTSANVSGTLAWNSTGNNHDDSTTDSFEDFDLTSSTSLLNEGNNILAIHGLNYSADSSDLIFMPKLEVVFADGDIDISVTGLLSTPTPRAANATIDYLGYIETPVTSPEHGFYDAPFQVTVSNVTENATIRYTTDGSTPNEASTEYTGPVTIPNTTCFRVGAFIDGWKPSFPRTDTYIFVDDVVLQQRYSEHIIGDNATWTNGQELVYGMDTNVINKTYYDASNQVVTVQDSLKSIPTISITTDYDNLYDPSNGIYVNATERWEVPASVELINPDGDEGFEIYAGLRIRGGWSRHDNYPKHAFRLFFRQQYGAGKLNYPLFEGEGVDEFDKIDLRTAMNYNWAKDNSGRNTFLRDVFARDTMTDMGYESPRSRYYHLYLNGQYWGLYMTEERPVATFGESYYGGDKDDYDAVKVKSWTESGAYSIGITDGTLDAYERLYNAAMSGFATNADYFAVQGLDETGEPDASAEKLLDAKNMIDYLLVIYYMAASDNVITSGSGDKALNNMYAIYNRVNPDGFKWIQHDCEHSLYTTYDINRTGPFTNAVFNTFEYFNAQTLHEKLSVNEEYRIKFADQVYKHLKNDGALVRTNCEARLDFRAAQIDRAIVANAARWGSINLDRDTWVNAVANTRTWFSLSEDRCNEVIGYLDEDGLIPSISPPLLSRAGGLVDSGTTVSLSAASGTIYYTTDGTDPRATGGGVAGSSYIEPISITRPIHLKARCCETNGEWSALAEDTFWTPEIPLAVTELMYHAPDGNAYDFIEVQNISDETVSLQGYKLDNAVDFKFKNAAQESLEPGEYLVVIDDIDSFNATYPDDGISIAGEFSGDFSNGGEEVDLEFRDNDLLSFTYDDARNWPQAADGAGHSLIPLDKAMNNQEEGSLNYGGNWRASTYPGGSPGEADPQLYSTIVLNEIFAHTDTDLEAPLDSNDKIELYNTSASAVTINGWYLSDSLDDTTKWLIPDTTISGHDFVVFDEQDFHFADTNGFGLNKAGEQVILSAPNRVVDTVRFKGQENVDTDVSWGRYPDGTGDWMMTQPTESATNQPAVASVRISELMYNPQVSGNDFEYIQLENESTQTVNFETTAGTYRIDGGVEFDFPIGTSLSSGETLWILSFNPTNTVKLNLFCSLYGLTAANETFIGGYSGSLSDRGERVSLERPQDSDDPLDPLDISWVVVDEVYYFDQSPWPQNADGAGYPLMRTSLLNWGVQTPTDTDGDLIPDSWEQLHFSTISQSSDDSDHDGFSNLEEYIAGTDPNETTSCFKVEELEANTISWTPISGRTYSIYWTDDLQVPFTLIAFGLPDTQSSFIDEQHLENTANYYRITVELDE